MEWCYDGLGGKIIEWTMENGSPKDHPSLLAFIVGRDGKVFSLLDNGQQYQASSLSKWAEEQANAYEKKHPTTRMPFARGSVRIRREGTDTKASSDEVDEAREKKQPILLYFGRGYHAPKDKVGKREVKRARKFEKGALNSKKSAAQAKGWVLLRFDLADEEHAAFAKQHGVTEAPTLMMWTPAGEKPVTLDRKITTGSLVMKMKKALEPAK